MSRRDKKFVIGVILYLILGTINIFFLDGRHSGFLLFLWIMAIVYHNSEDDE